MNEKDLCNQIIQFLNYQGGCFWRENAGMLRQETKGKSRMVRLGFAGKSDIIGIYKGRFVALEVKKPETRKNVTQHQTDFLEKVRHHGGIAAVVCSPEEALHQVEAYVDSKD